MDNALRLCNRWSNHLWYVAQAIRFRMGTRGPILMRIVDYCDKRGMWFKVELPDDVPDSEAHTGIPIGPPDLESLQLPNDLSLRLHNELFHRKLYTLKDVFSRNGELRAALQSALKLDVNTLMAIYAGEK